MCTETFLRLPEEKRNRFLEAAWEEFTRVKYSDVSINKIVQRAGIPRGSFYQYFAGKDDLFAYLSNGVRDWITEEFYSLLQSSGGDLFRVYLACYDDFDNAVTVNPLLDRSIRFLRLNVGMDLKKLAQGKPDDETSCRLLQLVDISAFRQQSSVFVRGVFALAGMTLACAVTDYLSRPEEKEKIRQDLETRLEIIRAGCMA